jgi:hypothetical protein
MMTMRGHYSLINNLALVCGSKTILPREFPKLLVGEAHIGG